MKNLIIGVLLVLAVFSFLVSLSETTKKDNCKLNLIAIFLGFAFLCLFCAAQCYSVL